jgi:hypothetical protein
MMITVMEQDGLRHVLTVFQIDDGDEACCSMDANGSYFVAYLSIQH